MNCWIEAAKRHLGPERRFFRGKVGSDFPRGKRAVAPESPSIISATVAIDFYCLLLRIWPAYTYGYKVISWLYCLFGHEVRRGLGKSGFKGKNRIGLFKSLLPKKRPPNHQKRLKNNSWFSCYCKNCDELVWCEWRRKLNKNLSLSRNHLSLRIHINKFTPRISHQLYQKQQIVALGLRKRKYRNNINGYKFSQLWSHTINFDRKSFAIATGKTFNFHQWNMRFQLLLKQPLKLSRWAQLSLKMKDFEFPIPTYLCSSFDPAFELYEEI